MDESMRKGRFNKEKLFMNKNKGRFNKGVLTKISWHVCNCRPVLNTCMSGK